MKKQDFYFDLPTELIAQYPLAERTDSRLLVYDRQTKTHHHHSFKDIALYLREGDLLVMNDTRVIPARLYGRKESGGNVELLVERVEENHQLYAHIKASKAPKPGMILTFDKGWTIQVLKKEDDLYFCQGLGDVYAMLNDIGHTPLPPYIRRSDALSDLERYQTVYAKHPGSVAAPTAGLHFDDALLQQLKHRGISQAYLTLHVGAGTFQPVRAERIDDHIMHRERFCVSEDLVKQIKMTKDKGHRVIAVGTTALRALESAAKDGVLQPYEGDTSIFIYPGYRFQVCDGLLTNFHLPESTLLMLVAAWIGYTETMALYNEAIAHRYRFFSYGDATLLL